MTEPWAHPQQMDVDQEMMEQQAQPSRPTGSRSSRNRRKMAASSLAKENASKRSPPATVTYAVDEVEEVTPTGSPVPPRVVVPEAGEIVEDDDDEPQILGSVKRTAGGSKPANLRNPLHVPIITAGGDMDQIESVEPECIDLTVEDDDHDQDQEMLAVADDDDDEDAVILEDDDESVLQDFGDEDDPQLVEIKVPARSKHQQAEDRRREGNEHFKRGDYHQALTSYSRAIDLVSNDASLYANRSACLMMLKRFKEALSDSITSVKMDPTYEKSYMRLIRINLALGDVLACETALAQYAKNKFSGSVVMEKSKLGELKKLVNDLEITTARKDFRRVVFLCDRIVEIAVGDVDTKIRRGYALLKLGRHQEASDAATSVMASEASNVDAHTIRGLCHYQQDNLDKSLSFFRAALQLNPDAVEPKILYRQVKQVKENRESATEYYKIGKVDDSKTLYLETMKLVTGDGDLKNANLESKFCFNLSLIFNKQRNFDEALAYAVKAIELNPSYYKALVHRGTIHNAKEMYEEAVRDFETALKIDPSKRELRTEIQNAKINAKRAKRKDYYKILDIPRTASDDEIRKAYKKRALLHHPDRHAGATDVVQKEQEKKFKDIGEAYEVLSDPKKRFRYDQGHDLNDSGISSGGFGDHDATQLFNMFFSTGGGMGMGGPMPGHSRHHAAGGRQYAYGNSRGGGCSYSGFQR